MGVSSGVGRGREPDPAMVGMSNRGKSTMTSLVRLRSMAMQQQSWLLGCDGGRGVEEGRTVLVGA
jgi:hypothetical protein